MIAACVDEGNKTVVIQQDNASPHNAAMDDVVRELGQEGGWNITFENQPPRSPDFNVLDLGFFNSLQTLQYKKRVFNINELIGAVQTAYKELEPATIDKCFLTLQSVMEAAMLDRGGNNFKIPHLKKDSLLRAGKLPRSLVCSTQAVDTANNSLNNEAVV